MLNVDNVSEFAQDRLPITDWLSSIEECPD
jgi:hypothetical protein